MRPTDSLPNAQPAPPVGAAAEFSRGWPIVATSAYGTAVSATAMLSYPLPFFMPALEREFGWTRSGIGAAVAFATLAMAVTVPFAGRLCDRVGVRRVILPSIVLFALCVAAMTTVTGDIRHFYAMSVLVVVAGAGTTYPCYTRAVTGAFNAARGTALGLSLVGTGLMAMVAPLVLPDLIAEHGWRAGYLGLASAALVAIVPVAFFLRDPARPAKDLVTAAPGFTLAQAMRDHRFWFLMLAGFLTTAVVGGTQLHSLAMLIDHGVAKQTAERTLALYGVSMIGSRILVGFIIDRIHAPTVAMVLYCAPAIGLFVLGGGNTQIAAFALMSTAMIAAAEGDLLGYMTSRYFGVKAFSEIFGWFVASFALGGMFGALIVGWIYDATNKYDLWLYGAAATCLVVAALLGSLGRYRFSLH